MSTLAEKLADDLAAKAIANIQATGDEDVVSLLSKTIGEQSQTLQEAFITSIRVQRAAIRAAELLERRSRDYTPSPE